MRKKYLKKELGTASTFWDNNWSKFSIDKSVQFVKLSPLKQIFETYFRKDTKILEGGCGLGHFVIYYWRKGYQIQGIDFADQTVKRVLQYDKDIPVKLDNVLNLSYPDNYF